MNDARVLDSEEFAAESTARQLVRNAEARAHQIIAHAERDAAELRAAAQHAVASLATAQRISSTPHGHLAEAIGLILRAELEGAGVGEIVQIGQRSGVPLRAEVIGFRGEQALLMPLGDTSRIEPKAPIWRTGAPLCFPCGESLLGRVLDGLGTPIDGGPAVDEPMWEVTRAAPPPLQRPPILRMLATGIRAIDGCMTMGEGQRLGLFAGAGHGKSTLLAQLAQAVDGGGQCADVVVLCLVGERGREVREFTDRVLAHARGHTVVICATSDAPALVRVRAAEVATAVAEWFRARDRRVLLLMDSVTRVARAQREVGLAAGEPPTRHGYPPSVFGLLPRLIERAGPAAVGSITALYTVLVAGNDFDEPIADEVRSLLDGHIVLDPRLLMKGHVPPISVLQSVSRVMPNIVSAEHAAAAAALRQLLAVHEEHRDLLAMGAIVRGQNPLLDRAVARLPKIEAFLHQPATAAPSRELSSTAELIAALRDLGAN